MLRSRNPASERALSRTVARSRSRNLGQPRASLTKLASEAVASLARRLAWLLVLVDSPARLSFPSLSFVPAPAPPHGRGPFLRRRSVQALCLLQLPPSRPHSSSAPPHASLWPRHTSPRLGRHARLGIVARDPELGSAHPLEGPRPLALERPTLVPLLPGKGQVRLRFDLLLLLVALDS